MQLHCPSVFQHGPSPQLKSFPLPCRGTKEKSHSVKKFYEIQPHLCFRSLFHSSPPPMSFQLNRFGKDWTWGSSFTKIIDFSLWFKIINHLKQMENSGKSVVPGCLTHLRKLLPSPSRIPGRSYPLKSNLLIILRVENTLISFAFESWKKCGTSSMNMSRWGRLFQWNFIAYIWRISFHFFYSWQMTYTVSYRTSALQHVTSPGHLNWAEYPWWMVDYSRWNIFLWRFPGALSLSWNTKSWKVIPRYYCQLFESMDIIQLINICHYSKSVKHSWECFRVPRNFASSSQVIWSSLHDGSFSQENSTTCKSILHTEVV